MVTEGHAGMGKMATSYWSAESRYRSKGSPEDVCIVSFTVSVLLVDVLVSVQEAGPS